MNSSKLRHKILKESSDSYNAEQSYDTSEFLINSFVLVAQRLTPETCMYTLWRGPLHVISNSFAEYTLLDLVTDKQITYHITQSKLFKFDPMRIDLEFFIEETLEMKGEVLQYLTRRFHVKWLN